MNGRNHTPAQNDKSLIGSGQRATRAFAFEVLNRKSFPVSFTLEDQIPVSTSSDVSVEPMELSGAQLTEGTGQLIWNLDLKPAEKRTLNMKYQVKYPKNRPVRLE